MSWRSRRRLVAAAVVVATTCWTRVPADARLMASYCSRLHATTSDACELSLAGPYLHVEATAQAGRPISVTLSDTYGHVLLSCRSDAGQCQAGNGSSPVVLPPAIGEPYVRVPLACEAATDEGVELGFWCSSSSP